MREQVKSSITVLIFSVSFNLSPVYLFKISISSIKRLFFWVIILSLTNSSGSWFTNSRIVHGTT